jgi:type II secretory pathway pseudopilin PulG
MGLRRCPNRHRPSAITLTELLVVIAILLILSVTVLPNLTAAIDSRRIREASRAVSTFVARAQSRTIGAVEPRGFMLQPAAADADVAVDLYFADVPPAYAGQEQDSVVRILPYGESLPTSVTAEFLRRGERDDNTSQEITRLCSDGDGIQFGGRGPYYRFTPPNVVSMWADDGQTPRNTPWPRGFSVYGPDAGLPFRIRRQPSRASSGLLQLQRGAAIDLSWSTMGTRVLSGTLAGDDLGPGITGRIVTNPTQPICVLFDAAGRPAELWHSGGVRTVISEPLFLLMGLAELCGNRPVRLSAGESASQESDRRGANWQYSDASWLCIDHNTGTVKFGPVAPRAASVLESQRYIRMTIGLGITER